MDFSTLAQTRQSCRSYQADQAVEPEKLNAILESARLAPSACNGQPYRITVCTGDAARGVARAVQGMGMNKFASDAPILLVISEEAYVPTAARGVARAVQGMGMNKFASDAPILLVISEEAYVPTAALGAKAKGIDYRSIDIGILAAYITAEATEQGLGTCILGWLDSDKIRKICTLDGAVKLVITLGYAKEGDALRPKKRKEMSRLVRECSSSGSDDIEA